REAARDEQVTELLQASFLAPRCLPGVAVQGREQDMWPLEGRESEPGLLPVRRREAPEGAAVECALEGDDETTAGLAGSLDPVEKHRLDGVLHRFGACVHDEVARRPRGSDAVELRLETQRERGLVLRMRIARGDGWHFAEHRLHPARVVLAQ